MDDDEVDQPGPSKPTLESASKPNINVVTVGDDEDEKVKEILDFQSFDRAFNVSSKNLPRRLRNSIPRSYFLIKSRFCHNRFSLYRTIVYQAYS